MNTLLITTQIVCYGVGAVSASLNIATFVRRRVKWRHLRTSRNGLGRSTMIPASEANLTTYRLVGMSEK